MKQRKYVGYRHELKYYLNYADYLILSKRLRATLPPDPNVDASGEYFIRSLYFDDYSDRALQEKMAGADHRDKFRLRAYNHDYDILKLERKRKDAGFIKKDGITLSKAEGEALINCDYGFLLGRRENFAHAMFAEFTTRHLTPRVIVDYVREPYVFPFEDVRITFDKDIRTAYVATDMFNPELTTYEAAPDGLTVLEVKFNKAMPAYIRELIQTDGALRSAASKYVLCRKYEM